jgi:hypothetical protein
VCVVVMGGSDSDRLRPILAPAGRLRFAAASKTLARFVNQHRRFNSTAKNSKNAPNWGIFIECGGDGY